MTAPLHIKATQHIPDLVKRLYAIVAELEAHFPGRPFTPDGHLVGSLGEVLAAYHYGLALLPCSAYAHDAVTSTGVRVQIKATQGRSIGLRHEPDYLLVLRLAQDGTAEEVFNGPGALAWSASGAKQSNGQRPISVTKLRALMLQVPQGERLPAVAAQQGASADVPQPISTHTENSTPAARC